MLVLVLNCGSSSVKVTLIDPESGAPAFRGSVDRVGAEEGESARRWDDGAGERTVRAAPGDYREAIAWLAERLPAGAAPDAVGHRVVHGGEEYVRPVLVDAEVLADLARCSDLAPLHNPPNLVGISAATELFSGLPQVAVFDTAFHSAIPPHAYRYAVPEEFYRRHGVRRYGFHGLSHRYVSERAAEMLGRSDLRLVTLHLGNGCSAAAVRGGVSIDTSMGLTPLEGLVMGTRSGDLDPAVPLLLQSLTGRTVVQVEDLLNNASGLEALSGGHSDMRDVERLAAAGDERARLAFEVFCYRARKYAGAYAAALGGLDALVFTAGIGENSAAVRESVCAGLEFLGLRLDATLNRASGKNDRDVGAADSGVRVLVIPTNEELVIARDTLRVVSG
jgi:acetate kinase